MFGKIGLPEILLVLVIVLLVFGVGRISKVSGELGKSIREFRDGLQGTKSTIKKTPIKLKRNNLPKPALDFFSK